MPRIKINVYHAAGAWYAARWIDDEYDGCDALLDLNGNASTAEALAAAEDMPLRVSGERTVERVPDLD